MQVCVYNSRKMMSFWGYFMYFRRKMLHKNHVNYVENSRTIAHVGINYGLILLTFIIFQHLWQNEFSIML